MLNQKGTARYRKYNASPKGIARRLRDRYNLSQDESEFWSVVLTHDDSRCSICGIPRHKVRRMGCHKYGGERMNRNLTLDHINPGMNDGNYRPLCASCNAIRGAAKFTDAEVLTEMRGWYRALFSLRRLYWLHTHYDVQVGRCIGGRLYSSDRMRKMFTNIYEGGGDE